MTNDQNIPERIQGAAITFSVKVNGKAIPQTFQVYAISVIKEVNKIPLAKLTIIDGEPSKKDFAISSGDFFIPGNEIELFAGQRSSEDSIFKGLIIKHSIAIRQNGSSQLKIECRDSAFKMTQGFNSAQYIDVKDSDIANRLFSKYKISVTKIEETSLKHPEMLQYNSSDWDFLLGRMDVNGKLVFINDGKAEVRGPDFSPDAVLKLEYGATIHEFDAEMDVRNQYAEVKALSWDPANQEVVEVQGEPATAVKESGNISSNDLSKVTGLESLMLRHPGNISREELQALANAGAQKSMLAKIRGRVSFNGFAKIQPGDLIELKGLGNRFNGKVFVSGIKQDVSNGGWITTAQFGMDPEWLSKVFQTNTSSAPSLVPSLRGLHTGVVAQLENDPAGEDRILIKIPMIDMAAEGVWARVATLDAGNQRGSFFRPDIGDEVLVGFLNDDPRELAVLGMLNSSNKPAPLQPKDDNKEKGFFFASKMKMLFQEEDKSMTFETPAGNKLVLSEKDKGITIQDQNGNKIIMNKEGVSIESNQKISIKTSGGDIELEGINVKQKAKAEFKAEGSAGIEISSSAIAKLKGSLVQIN